MIEIKNVDKVYEAREGKFQALFDVNLTINDGDMFGIIGESGAGKSTLVRCINLLERPTSGQIIIDGQDITNFTGKQLNETRHNIGMIFQHFSLFQQQTVLKNVMYPMRIRGVDKVKAEARARELLKLVGLEGKEGRYPSELSGGQQQRVAIARALVNEPEFLLCDEATSALDSRTTIQILDLLKDINQKLGVTLVVITHALAVVEQICNRVAVIDKGVIVEQSLTECDPSLIEAAKAFGSSNVQIIVKVVLRETLPSLIRGLAITFINLFSYSAMAGAVGAGGLGDVAIRYGYQRFMPDVMLFSIVLCVVLVIISQTLGDWLARKVDHRRRA